MDNTLTGEPSPDVQSPVELDRRPACVSVRTPVPSMEARVVWEPSSNTRTVTLTPVQSMEGGLHMVRGTNAVSCGGGVTQRRRTCTKPAPDHGGNDREGPAVERKQCNTHFCPINGGFTEWSGFGECTVSCGGGTMTRERECTNPKPQYGGKACTGATKDTEKCGTRLQLQTFTTQQRNYPDNANLRR